MNREENIKWSIGSEKYSLIQQKYSLIQQQIYTTPRELKGEYSDGHHTFNELYEFRKLYNAALFNELAIEDNPYDIHKSKRHYDGEACFGGGYFIVVAILPTGQISNHYNLKDWDLFKIPETKKSKYPYDGHTSQDVVKRLTEFINDYQGNISTI